MNVGEDPVRKEAAAEMTPSLRLPKAIEAHPRAPQLMTALASPVRALRPGGHLKVPGARPSRSLREALRGARRAGRIVRSLEKAETILAAEARGQRMADRRSGASRGARISRLLILAADGSERFYRNVETLLDRHHPRVLAVVLAVDARELGAMVFGAGAAARLLMIDQKDAVGTVLLALADQWADR